MKTIKIQKFETKGLRGIRTRLPLELDTKSILLYGDGGTGKSSISDVFEWFYYDRVEHLSNEEIGRGGAEALRNIFLANEDEGYHNIEYNDSTLDCKKSISLKRKSLVSDYTSKTDNFNKYKDDSTKENLILRYKDLVNFIIASKKNKLEELSNIIGFSEVTKVRATLKKVVFALKKEIKLKNFDGQISAKQGHLIENTGQNITSDSQFVGVINKLIQPLNIRKQITSVNEIESVLALIRTPDDSKVIEQQAFYNKVSDFIANMPNKLDEIERSYKEYYKQHKEVVSVIEKIKLEELLSKGIELLRENIITDDSCPLCLQSKKRRELLKELEDRSEELKAYKQKRENLIVLARSLQNGLLDYKRQINGLLGEKYFQDASNVRLKKSVEEIKGTIEAYMGEVKTDITKDNNPKDSNELEIDKEKFADTTTLCKEKYQLLEKGKKDNLKFQVYGKIEHSRKAYEEIDSLQKEKEAIEKQRIALDAVYAEFVKKQKDELEGFLNYFSGEVNELYQFMNPGEKVEEIKLIPLEKDDELTGLTIQFKFYDSEVAPPQKYLSESHLNCLGVSFFLTSVKAFNKRNKFFILDDVISSYDSTHRKRFADLLIEKFQDYQIILLTHEKNWFDYVNYLVKGKDWKVNVIKWHEDKGTYIDNPAEDLKVRIETKILTGSDEGLGNDIRKYLEHILKLIALNLEVKVRFLFNDINEDRMSNELLAALKSAVKKHGSDKLKKTPIISRLMGSIFLGNKDSHDSSFTPSIDDFKAFWKDVQDLENLFFCTSCKKFISREFYDNATKKSKCKCGRLVIDWK